MPRGIPAPNKPICRCGCGLPVKRIGNTYRTADCVPRSLRSAGARKSRRAFTLNRKARLFGDLLKRLDALQAEEGKMTRSDLVGVFDLAYTRGYENGYSSGLENARRQLRRAA